MGEKLLVPFVLNIAEAHVCFSGQRPEKAGVESSLSISINSRVALVGETLGSGNQMPNVYL